MTLDDRERHNKGFMDLFGDLGLQNTYQKWTAPKSIEIDMEKLHIKFSALNTDFENPSLDFLVSKNLRTKASKSVTNIKVVILALLASLSWKWLQIGMGMLSITTNTSDAV